MKDLLRSPLNWAPVIVHIQFHEVKGTGNMYRGQWQGGRVTTTKKEKQV